MVVGFAGAPGHGSCVSCMSPGFHLKGTWPRVFLQINGTPWPYTIEPTLIQAGAKPGKGCTYQDSVRAAC